MKWTGEDILAQLDEGWELEEIAAATGMGIAKVKRLIREQRYKNRTQAKVETMTTTKQEETTQAEHPEWEWSSIRALSMLPGAPPYGTLQYRFRSGTAQWAHYETAKPGDLEGVEADPRAKTLGRLTPGTTWEPLEDEKATKTDEALEGAISKDAANTLQRIIELVEIHTKHKWDDHSTTDLPRLLASVFCDAARVPGLEQDMGEANRRIAELESRQKLSRDDIDNKIAGALTQITEVLAHHTAFGGDELGVSEMCELIEAAFEDAGKLPVIKRELKRVSENLLAVHRECERRGYGADDKRPAVEKVREIIDQNIKLERLAARLNEQGEQTRERMIRYQNAWQEAEKQEVVYKASIEDLQGQVRRRDERIKELESKRELTLEETDTPERHVLGLTEKEAGGTIALWLDRLADLENEIATAYALRSTEDFADPDDRCWDLEHATKHVRRWQEVVEEQDREAGR